MLHKTCNETSCLRKVKSKKMGRFRGNKCYQLESYNNIIDSKESLILDKRFQGNKENKYEIVTLIDLYTTNKVIIISKQ